MRELRENPRDTSTPHENPGLAALARGAAVVERPGRGLLRLTGKDPLGMLNAILTNDVPADAGLGAYALLLNPKGRVQADLRVLKTDDAVLVDTEPEGASAAREILGRYAPFSRVKLEDLSETWSVLGLYGPLAGELLDGLDLAEHRTAGVEVGGGTLLAVGVAAPVTGYDLLGPSENVVRSREYLLERGAVPASPEAYETARIEAGTPRFSADITPENFPGESGILDRAVDFGKGCYPGQETVARMRYRGHPNKTLYRISTKNTLEAGTPILQAGKSVGSVTSVAPLQIDGRSPALCYLSRKTDLEAPIVAAGSEVRVLGEVS
jgi:folate-binding protein YgfZ